MVQLKQNYIAAVISSFFLVSLLQFHADRNPKVGSLTWGQCSAENRSDRLSQDTKVVQSERVHTSCHPMYLHLSRHCTKMRNEMLDVNGVARRFMAFPNPSLGVTTSWSQGGVIGIHQIHSPGDWATDWAPLLQLQTESKMSDSASTFVLIGFLQSHADHDLILSQLASVSSSPAAATDLRTMLSGKPFCWSMKTSLANVFTVVHL